MKQRVSVFFCFLLAFLLVGCAPKTCLHYDYPAANSSCYTNLKVSIAQPEDKRQPNEDIDKMWANNPTEDIQKVMTEELKATGLFNEVIPLASDQLGDNASVALTSTVTELSWEIPNRKEQENKMMAVSIFTGGIGAMIYGSGETPFWGKATMRLNLKENETEKVLLDKEYTAQVEEQMTRFKTDSYVERSRVIGLAVKQIMEEFKTDLTQTITQ